MVKWRGRMPNLPPGAYSLALWLPNPAPALRLNSDFAVRLANRDTAWWRSLEGRYGANLFGVVKVP